MYSSPDRDSSAHRSSPSASRAPGHAVASSRASERRASSKKSSSTRPTKCVAAARGDKRRRAGKHRKAGKSCAAKRSKTSRTKPSVSPKRSGSAPASSEPPGGSGSSPGGSTTQSEPTPVSEPVAPVEPVAPAEPAAPFRFFAPTSFWNEPLAANAPLDPSSAEVVGAFDALIASEEQAKNGPWINTTEYSIPVYTVPAGQPTVSVKLGGASNAGLSAAWSAVPLPPTATPAAGTDGDLFIWQPSTDRLWEFWRLVHGAEGWQASWGGAMQNVLSSPGVYGPEAWPGAQSWWGVSASSLSLLGGLISLEDLELGQIDHALEMAIPGVRAGVYASPARRSDGKTANPLSLPEGAHLRLNPNLDLAALHLPRLTLMLAEAAQRYGILIVDGSSVAEFPAQDPTPTGTNPYAGPGGYFEGKYPNQLLASFPWNQLELLKMELHTM
jgi:hypothetical protein